MRLRTLALLPMLTLPLAARADTIDDLVLTGLGHTIKFSLDSLVPDGNLVGSSEFETEESAFATVDGVSGSVIQVYFFVIFANQQPSGDNIIGTNLDLFVAGLINNDRVYPNAPLVMGNAPNVGASVALIPGNYILTDMRSVPLYTLSITPDGSPSPVPEPSTLALLVTGSLALGLGLRSRLA